MVKEVFKKNCWGANLPPPPVKNRVKEISAISRINKTSDVRDLSYIITYTFDTRHIQVVKFHLVYILERKN